MKYFFCKNVGYFSKYCPNRVAGNRSNGGNSSSSVRINFVNMVSSTLSSNDLDEYVVLEINEIIQLTEDDVDALVNSWLGDRRDYWKEQGDEICRVHVCPRRIIFTPNKTGCPVPVQELSTIKIIRKK